MDEQIWVIDDDRSIRWVLEKALEKAEFQVKTFASAEGILDRLTRETPKVIVTDIRMPGMDGIDLLKEVQQSYPHIPVIVITAHSDLDSAISAYHSGAFEYLPKPFDVDDAIELVTRACLQSSSKEVSETETSSVQEIIGEAPAMQEVFRAIGRLSRSHISVIINGESGTGKELVAHALHRHSLRRDEPFIALNMAAIAKDLLESELFGHERGAFTGAQQKRAGRFEQANGGTLFLDEIGDMPADLQTRLLRVLSNGEFYRVGGHTPIKTNVRIIAATHQNLDALVKKGDFREDLYHRLNVIRIHIPALRERRQDIPILLKHFLAVSAKELEVEPKVLVAEAEEFLSQLEWPGNVRQLENTCRWIMVMASGQAVHVDDLPSELFVKAEGESENISGDWASNLKCVVDEKMRSGEMAILDDITPQFERLMILSALGFTGGKKQEAAKVLGWGRNTLTRKIKELAIEA
ncbi:MAG: nitrogen regulation protein NR(I) [Methylococcales bacterium]|jgi:two-component system, NtrC family, nitrogen regulation response regulator GlnG|nr:nitrogen regulation protein NR(I) [Methylococcales bacterium]